MNLGYNFISNLTLETPKEDFYVSLWKLTIPSKVSCFLWSFGLDRLPAKSNLRARNVNGQNGNWLCPFYLQ